MKQLTLRIISLLLVVCLVGAVFTACDQQNPEDTQPVHVDYVAQVKLDMNSTTKKLEVQWGEHSHIDGDTSHFEVPRTVDSTGLIKARYLAVNTPESTGKIEEWGKAASRFTQEKLSTAASILLESDSENWNYDGNGRYLLWIWYKPTADAEYRCLNIELLQNGLAVGSSASEGRYGKEAVAAIAQATTEKLYVFSDNKDPEFPYGEATSVTLKELRLNPEAYEGTKVAVEGIITSNSDFTAYVESYDAESDMWYAMQVYYGFNHSLDPVLTQGSKVRITGVLSKFYDTYQISSLSYDAMDKNDPANTVQLSTDNPIAFRETDAATFTGNKTLLVGEEEKTFSYGSLALFTSISMKNLEIKDIYTTGPGASDTGAMTFTCEVDGITVSVRTAVLKDEDGNLITADAYEGKTIDVQGIVDVYEGKYQIRVFSTDDITVH